MIRILLCVLSVLVLSACATNQTDLPNSGARAEVPAGAVIHYVRIRSGLGDDDAMTVLHRRAEQFRRVPGLLQKVYGRDAETGEICGIYIFESQGALEAFRQSELALTISDAYQVESARIERYDVLFTLHPGVRAR
jgi:hypothetical protein